MGPIKPTRLAPVGQADGGGPRWGVAASVALHLVALALTLGIAARQRPPESAGAPSFDLVFEGPAPTAASLPPAQPADVPSEADAPIGRPTPPPSAPPDPDTVTPSQPDLADVPPTSAAPSPAARPAPSLLAPLPPPLAPPVPDAEPQPLSAPQAASSAGPAPSPVEVLPEPAPPEVRLQPPADPAPPAEARPIMPMPPPPLPPPPQPARPRPAPAARAAPGTFTNPMDLSLGPPAQPPSRRGIAGSRGLDLATPPASRGPSRSDPYAQIRARNASENWNRGLLQYWLQHRFYPQQAAANGEQGSVTIELTVARSGLVESVRVLSTSGSQFLDMAAVGTFRSAHLRPFTDEMREDRITFPVPITYMLIR